MKTITYEFISTGENKGRFQIFADNQPLTIIDRAPDGWSSCSQENTLERVLDTAKKHFIEFLFPYMVDQGSGYVFSCNPYKITR